ncbi:MAG: hypothetical protein F7C35_02030 [Desulfurococcales archaeon]|nr:hypothetical protein [Desulfurococcales archaeon]
MDDKGWRKVAREVSRAGVIASTIYILASFSLLFTRHVHEHAKTMLYSGLLLFPHSVAIAYVASGATGRSTKATGVAALLSIPALLAPLAALYDPFLTPSLLFLLGGLPLALASLIAAGQRGGSLRLSLVMTAVTYISTALTIASWLLRRGGLFSQYSLGLTMSYTIALIYSVTFHSLPATYKDKPVTLLGYVSVALTSISSLLVVWDLVGEGLPLLLLSMYTYIVGARLYRVPQYIAWVRSNIKRGTAAYRGMKYYLDGHIFVIATALLATAMIGYEVLKPGPCSVGCILLSLHVLALGFSWMHVAIHAPMMLPVIVGVRHAKRYNIWPYLLTILSLLLWPGAGLASLILILASFAAMILVFLRL